MQTAPNPAAGEDSGNNLNLLRYGEFSVTLCKVNGSLGFTLSRGPESDDGGDARMRHSVKALVKEPAISDGRIKPGDKLISANGVECDALDHQVRYNGNTATKAEYYFLSMFRRNSFGICESVPRRST